MDIKKYLTLKSSIINRELINHLPKDNSLISRAMRYSVLAGGKRLRPILVIEGARVCGGKDKNVMPAACAVEFIHSYSLIHDDLPAMDNDDLRRGKPTSHKKFGEAAAILTGDALLTDAFRIFSKSKSSAKQILEAMNILSTASGYKGMIGGQAADTVEANNWVKKSKTLQRKNLKYVHENKTAALITASLLIGAVLSGADKKQLAALRQYGGKIGLAFQIIDDILDIKGDKKLLGKKGSDKDNNKLTFPAVYGLEKSFQMAQKNILEANDCVNIFGGKAVVLKMLANYIVDRKY